MKAVTLRNLSPELERALTRRSRELGASLNRTVTQLLEQALHLQMQTSEVHHDLDALFGCWTRKEAHAFDRALADQRRVDPELWT
ncbi:MAG: hypothetical protein HZA54_15235 [Planctomycetes bacterium]|nr:hypothetical protein [Planctomycetota bacterium]